MAAHGGSVLDAGAAAAADYPNGNPPSVNPQSGSTVRPSSTTRPATLPFTGGDVAGLAAIGAGAAVAGVVMVRHGKKKAAATA